MERCHRSHTEAERGLQVFSAPRQVGGDRKRKQSQGSSHPVCGKCCLCLRRFEGLAVQGKSATQELLSDWGTTNCTVGELVDILTSQKLWSAACFLLPGMTRVRAPPLLISPQHIRIHMHTRDIHTGKCDQVTNQERRFLFLCRDRPSRDTADLSATTRHTQRPTHPTAGWHRDGGYQLSAHGADAGQQGGRTSWTSRCTSICVHQVDLGQPPNTPTLTVDFYS